MKVNFQKQKGDNIMSAFKGLFTMFSGLFFYCLKFLVVLAVPFLLSLLVFFLISLKRGQRPKKRSPIKDPKYSRRIGKLKRLYIDFPRELVKSFFTSDPDVFDTYGVHIIAGEQGSGKTMCAVHLAKMTLERNPKAKLASNISLNFQDDVIGDWRDILQLNNGVYGQIIFLDEIQNWFSSNESRNFPPDMLTEVKQQRKQRKIIIGTSQVFTRVAKPIREQATYLYLPFTVFGLITFVRVYRPKLKEDGTLDRKSLVRFYFFVHDDELRNCYDTFEKVKRLSLTGFKDSDKQLKADDVV